MMAWLAFSLGESLLQRLDPHFDGVLPHTGRHLSEWIRLFEDSTVILLLSNVSDLRHSLLGPRIHGKIPDNYLAESQSLEMRTKDNDARIHA